MIGGSRLLQELKNTLKIWKSKKPRITTVSFIHLRSARVKQKARYQGVV